MAQGVGRVGDADVGDAFLYGGGEVLADNGPDVVAGHDGDIFMAVGGGAAHRHEHATLFHLARVAFKAGDVLVGVADYLERLYLLEEL